MSEPCDMLREEMYEKYCDAMSDFCPGCIENGEYLEGIYREDLDASYCQYCYEEELENLE